jgi:hypothetical protein
MQNIARWGGLPQSLSETIGMQNIARWGGLQQLARNPNLWRATLFIMRANVCWLT